MCLKGPTSDKVGALEAILEEKINSNKYKIAEDTDQKSFS